MKKGSKHTQETKDKMAKNHADVSGKNNPMYGITGENHHRYGIKHTRS